MKRILALALIVIALLSLVACAQPKDDTSKVQPMEVEATLSVDTDATGVVQENSPANSTKITLGDKEYEFPVVVSELVDNGWYFDENVRENLEPVDASTKKELYDMNLYHDEYGVRLMLLEAKNDTTEEQELRDCYLTKIGINRSMMEDPEKVNIVLPGGITFKSTAADVLRVYGTSEEHPNFTAAKLNGSTADYICEQYSISFTFYEDGTIEYICFDCYAY